MFCLLFFFYHLSLLLIVMFSDKIPFLEHMEHPIEVKTDNKESVISLPFVESDRL